MRVSRFFQVCLGVTLALVLFVGGGALIFSLLMFRMWGEPPRPTFANDDPNYKTKVLAAAKAKKEKEQQEKAAQAKAKQDKTAKATPKATPKPTLEPGAYEAKVTWPEGLSIRSEPAFEAETVGGVDMNTPIVVLEESSDGVWQKIRVKSTEETGWIKAGNTEKVSNPDPTAQTSPDTPSPETP